MSVKLHAAIAASILSLLPIATTASVFAQSVPSEVIVASSPPGPAGPTSGYINADSVNVRSGPGTDRPVLYVAPRGTQMQILGQYGSGTSGWWKVRATSGSVPRSEGWVFNQFLTIGGAPPTVNYYDRGRQDGRADAQAGRTYDPVRGSRDLPASASREYTRGYADGYQAGRPGGNQNSLRQYYDRGYQDGLSAGRAGRTYDPVGGSRNLPADASREYTRGYAEGYRSGRP